MTNRVLQFASTALIGTVIVASVIAVAYGRITVRNLTELGADQNSAVAQSLVNAVRQPLDELLRQPLNKPVADLQDSASASGLPALINRLIEDLSVVKVKVFNTDGITIYSTATIEIGWVEARNPGVIAALAGDTISDIVRRDTFNSFDGVMERRDLIQTYMPVRDDGDAIIGAFEVYSNVTPLLARIATTKRRIGAGVTAILGVFYLLLLMLYRRTDRRLQAEQAKTRMYLEEIESAKDSLERRVAERTETVERLRSFLQTALDGIPDPAIVINKNYRITAMNQAAREAYVTDRSEGEQSYCFRALFGRDTPCAGTTHVCTLRTGDAYKSTESVIAENGQTQTVEIRTTPLRDNNGNISGAISVVHDLNEREQAAYQLRLAKERAEISSQVKSEFIATMSHEIRTPMNAVLGMTDLLQLTSLTRRQQGYIHTIQSSGTMLLSLLDNILDFTKMNVGALAIQKQEFNVVDLLERVLQIMGYDAYSKGLELVGCLETDLGLRVAGDKGRLRQILVNLARNAVKYSERGSIVIRIRIDSEQEGRIKLLFTVSDCGIGMTDDVIARLFTPFASAEDPDTAKRQGGGLGLTICKQLVEQMGGEIDVDSELGRGTVVRFSVPVEWKASHQNGFAGNELALQGKRILAVHRHTITDEAVCSYALALGMCCDIAATDGEALERLQAGAAGGEPYAAVVIDTMPNALDGLVLARRIRALEMAGSIPIVLLTPISTSLEPGKVSSIGRIRIVNKPILPSELLMSFQDLICVSQSSAANFARIPEQAQDNDGLRILVAEDNPVNRHLLTRMLESMGYSAYCVDNGPAVLDALSRVEYNLVLMDCQMPEMDGEQVTEVIRRDVERFRTQPIVVAITADASHEHQATCLAAGMDDFIGKPIRLHKLKRGMTRWRAMLALRSDDMIGAGQSENRNTEQRLVTKLADRIGSSDTHFLSHYIDLFLDDTEARLNKLSDALERQDTDVLRRESHALKGACLEFGITRMRDYCDDISASAASGSIDDVQHQMRLLRREFDRIKPVFEAERAAQARHSSPDR